MFQGRQLQDHLQFRQIAKLHAIYAALCRFSLETKAGSILHRESDGQQVMLDSIRITADPHEGDSNELARC